VTETGRSISEEELHAYVDGLLDPRRRQVVERYLQAHPAAAQRAAVYREQREGLRAAFANRAAEPLPSSLNLGRLVEERLFRRRRPWLAGLAVAVALGVGATGGWLAGERPSAGIDALAQEAGVSYAVYASDQQRPVEIGAAQRDNLSRWLSSRLNRPVAPPDLSMIGYRLLGGRLVATAHGPAGLFIYEDSRLTRLGIFVRPMTSGQTEPIQTVDIGDLDGCAWIDRGVGYIVIAAESYQRLLEISQHVKQQAQAPG
jgi:anti-sigma factor RsiW